MDLKTWIKEEVLINYKRVKRSLNAFKILSKIDQLYQCGKNILGTSVYMLSKIKHIHIFAAHS